MEGIVKKIVFVLAVAVLSIIIVTTAEAAQIKDSTDTVITSAARRKCINESMATQDWENGCVKGFIQVNWAAFIAENAVPYAGNQDYRAGEAEGLRMRQAYENSTPTTPTNPPSSSDPEASVACINAGYTMNDDYDGYKACIEGYAHGNNQDWCDASHTGHAAYNSHQEIACRAGYNAKNGQSSSDNQDPGGSGSTSGGSGSSAQSNVDIRYPDTCYTDLNDWSILFCPGADWISKIVDYLMHLITDSLSWRVL
jgi:hypothetical protein